MRHGEETAMPVCTENLIRVDEVMESPLLRHQLIVLRRRLHGRIRLTNHDRWFLIQLYRWFPSIVQVLTVIRPETLVRWHRAGFRCYWRWKSVGRGGRRSRAASLPDNEHRFVVLSHASADPFKSRSRYQIPPLVAQARRRRPRSLWRCAAEMRKESRARL